MELQQQCRCLISPTANSLLTTANACVVNTKQLNFSRITTLVPVKAGRNSDTEANAAVTSKVTVMTNEDPTTAYYQRDFANVAKTESDLHVLVY